MKIKPEICDECTLFDWKDNCHFCNHYRDFLNNLNPCNNGEKKFNNEYNRLVTQKQRIA